MREFLSYTLPAMAAGTVVGALAWAAPRWDRAYQTPREGTPAATYCAPLTEEAAADLKLAEGARIVMLTVDSGQITAVQAVCR